MRRRLLGASLAIVSISLAATGIVLGVYATTVPDVPQGSTSFNETVRVYVDQPGIRLDVEYNVDPMGEVIIFITAPAQPSFRAYVLLTCDARLVRPLVQGEDPEDPVLNLGQERRCHTTPTQGPTLGRTDIATQVISGQVDVSGFLTISGHPVVPLSASGGAYRVARTPTVILGGIADDPVPDELEDHRLTEPSTDLEGYSTGEDSKVTVSLNSWPTETIDAYTPEPGNLNLSVQTSAIIEAAPTGSQVWGSVSWNGDALIPAGYVRWSDAGGTAWAQLSLLLSGAFLGVAASILIEFLFDRLRTGQTAAMRPSNNRTSAPPSRHGGRSPRSSRRRPIAGERRPQSHR